MSRRPPRPEPLQRLVRRSDRRCLAAGLWFAMLVVLQVVSIIDENRIFEGATVVTATVDAGYDPGDGDLTVPVRIDERLVQTRELVDAPLPAAGEEVQVEVAAGQPDVVRIVGTSYPLHVDLAWALGPLVVCAVLAFGRRRFVARVQRRAVGEEAAFALRGVLRPTRWSRRRAVLDLYALDGPTGAPALASVPVVATGGIPLEGRLAVECKGVPRPYGLVVARAGDVVLWPSTPATGGRGRPALPSEVAPVQELPPSPPPPFGTARVRPLHLRPGPWLMLPAVVLMVAVGVVGRLGVVRDRERLRTWDHFPATVVDGSAGDCEVTVRFDFHGDGREIDVPVGDCGDVATGGGYEVLVDPNDPDAVLLAASLYDPWTPALLAGTVLVFAAGRALADWRNHRRALVLDGGRWSEAMCDRSVTPAVLRSRTDPPGAVRGRLDRPPSGRQWPVTPITVAGDIGPGGRFLLWSAGDRWLGEHPGIGRGRWRWSSGRAAPK